MKRVLLLLASVIMGSVVFALCAAGAITLAHNDGETASTASILAFGSPGILIGLYLGAWSLIAGRWPELSPGSY